MSEGNRNYKSGREAEYYVQNVFRKAGFATSRSASSKGIWDLTAMKRLRRREIEVWICVVAQVKSRRIDK